MADLHPFGLAHHLTSCLQGVAQCIIGQNHTQSLVRDPRALTVCTGYCHGCTNHLLHAVGPLHWNNPTICIALATQAAAMHALLKRTLTCAWSRYTHKHSSYDHLSHHTQQ